MRHRGLFWFSTIAISLLAAVSTLLLLSVPVEARKKTVEKFTLINLTAHPTTVQKIAFSLAYCDMRDMEQYDKILPTLSNEKFLHFHFYDYCAEKHKDFNSEIVESNGSFLVSAQILLHQGSRELDVLLGVKNYKDSPPIELLPQKVFLVDNHGEAHSAVTEYAAKAAIASEHHLPQFAPPPLETYYTITQVTRDSHVPILQADPSQPQFTIYETQMTARLDYSRQVGYEIGYLLRAWRIKRDAKRQLKWIDENWFHRKRLSPGELQTGILMFDDVLENPFIDFVDRSRKQAEEQVKDPASAVDDAIKDSNQSPPSSSDEWIDKVLNASKPDGSVKLVIFVGEEQFIFQFGPEVVEVESR